MLSTLHNIIKSGLTRLVSLRALAKQSDSEGVILTLNVVKGKDPSFHSGRPSVGLLQPKGFAMTQLKQSRKSYLYLIFACIFFSTSALAAVPLSGKTIDIGNYSSSSLNYYSKIRFFPTGTLNNPACTVTLTGMLEVDTIGNLYICNGGIWENVTSPWDADGTGKIIFPKAHLTAQVAIGSNSIPNNLPLPFRPDLVKLYLSQRNSSGLNQIEFKPNDRTGNVGLEMYTGGTRSGTLRTSTYFNFLVGERGNDWDARIEYYYNSAAVSGLKFIGRRKNGKSKPPNMYPELNLYRNGNVDFGSDENDPPVPPLPARNPARKVKVYGNTKADHIILVNGGPAQLLKVSYIAAGTGGYYAVYAP